MSGVFLLDIWGGVSPYIYYNIIITPIPCIVLYNIKFEQLMNLAEGMIHLSILYTMKVSRQKSFAASCILRPSQKNFCKITQYFLLSIFEKHTFILKVTRTCKKTAKTTKPFCLETLMVYSILLPLHWIFCQMQKFNNSSNVKIICYMYIRYVKVGK